MAGKWSDWDVLTVGLQLHRYLIDKETPTGTCAVTIVDKERSLTTRLGAANKYTVSHLKEPEQLGKDFPGDSFASDSLG